MQIKHIQVKEKNNNIDSGKTSDWVDNAGKKNVGKRQENGQSKLIVREEKRGVWLLSGKLKREIWNWNEKLLKKTYIIRYIKGYLISFIKFMLNHR